MAKMDNKEDSTTEEGSKETSLEKSSVREPGVQSEAQPRSRWKRQGFHSIRWEIGLAFSLLIVTIGLLLGIFSIENNRSILRQQTLYMVVSLGRGLASASSNTVVGDADIRAPLLSRMCSDVKRENTDVARILVLDPNDKIIGDPEVAYALEDKVFTYPTNLAVAQNGPELHHDETLEESDFNFVLQTPILYGVKEELRGKIFLVYSKASINNAINRSRDHLLLFLGVFLVLGISSSFLIAGMVIGPARRLAEAAHAIGSGDLDARVLVRGHHELGLLAHSFNDMTHRLKVAQQAMIAKERMDFELSIAQQIQRSLLPLQFPTPRGYNISAICASAYEVGGDYYDLIQVDGEHLGFAVGDVSGKGFPGLLVMSMVRHIVRTMAHQYASPRQVLVQSNQLITPDIQKGMFVTLFYGVIDLRNHVLKFVNAGHPPLIVIYPDGRTKKIDSQGRPLGLGIGPFFDARLAEEQLEITPGAVLIQYSDGIYDAQNQYGEQYGEDRFFNTVSSLGGKDAAGIIDGIYDEINSFVNDKDSSADDITVLAIERMD